MSCWVRWYWGRVSFHWCLCRTLVEDETRGFGRAEGTAGEEVDAHVEKEQQTSRAALVVCVRHNV